ncbi:hypothetical protein [Cellulomonas alba]|uniref:Uncharacterized protein n=1 Tax=Cellulomonas alba TaxID=3053467 RepID=A0ABT7SFB6_9CELL|nr:hypothetical protein [Cellulomonas alba]MDM7854876.1 hypothetical protein [Cellulomonas alba]
MVPALPRLDAADPNVRGRHLLALPADVAEDEVEVLAQSRFAGARWVDAAEPPTTTRSLLRPVTAVLGIRAVGADTAPSRTLRIGRRSTLTGPYRVEPTDAVALNLPPATTLAYVVEAPRERGAKPYPGGDRDGLKRAFPDGLPVLEEERVVQWLVAAARRLGGAVRTAERGVVLTPDPDSAIDLTVYSDRWLEPTETLAVVRRTQPAAMLTGPEAGWSGPMAGSGRAAADVPPGLPEAGGRGLSAALARYGVMDEAERARLSAEAAAFDQHMLTNPPLPRGYGVLVDLAVDGLLAVEVAAADDELPPLLQGLPWTAKGVVGYHVRWEPLLIEELEAERPSLEHRVARGRAAPQLQAVARSLHAAVGQEIADEAGFLVDPADL